MELEFATFFEPLSRHAAQRPDQTAITFLLDGEREEASWSYQELVRQVRAIAAVLQEKGARGERALLLHPPGLEFVAALLGCFAAGSDGRADLPALVQPPQSFGRAAGTTRSGRMPCSLP